MMSGGSGPTSLEPLAFYDPDTCSWRTCQATLFEDSAPFSGRLPRLGMTRRGRLYELPTSAHPIAESGCSSLLPTPLNADGGGPRGSSAGWGLRDVSRQLLPTPTVSDANEHGTGGADLRTTVGLLPTPRARDHKGRDPNPRGVDLNEAVALLSTPTAQAAKHSADDRGHGTFDDSNLWSVAARVSNGALTAPPSAVGSASPDVLFLAPPLTMDEADDDSTPG